MRKVDRLMDSAVQCFACLSELSILEPKRAEKTEKKRNTSSDFVGNARKTSELGKFSHTNFPPYMTSCFSDINNVQKYFSLILTLNTS